MKFSNLVEVLMLRGVANGVAQSGSCLAWRKSCYPNVSDFAHLPSIPKTWFLFFHFYLSLFFYFNQDVYKFYQDYMFLYVALIMDGPIIQLKTNPKYKEKSTLKITKWKRERCAMNLNQILLTDKILKLKRSLGIVLFSPTWQAAFYLSY